MGENIYRPTISYKNIVVNAFCHSDSNYYLEKNTI